MLYRRFGYLQSRVLLKKQDELRQLEQQLDNMDEDDMCEDVEIVSSMRYQGELRKSLLDEIELKFCEYGT